MFRKLASFAPNVSMPISLPGSSSKNDLSRSKSSRRHDPEFAEALKWINDQRRESNEQREVAAKRLLELKPGGTADLKGLGLTDLPDDLLAHASGALQIKLAGNNLNAVPRRILSFAKLQHLDLSRNRLDVLPGEIGWITSLRKLDVSQNRLVELSEGIGALTKLKSLYAGRNAIEHLPNTIGDLTKLKKLSLGGNLLMDLPKNLKACKSLEELDLSQNHFEQLPDTLGALVELHTLNVADNQLKDEVFDIDEVTAAQEGIEPGLLIDRAIPESLGDLKHLKRFDVSGNPLTFLPTGFGGFRYASKRDMTITRLTNRPSILPDLEIHIGNTPLPIELANLDGRLERLPSVPPVNYKALYQPPHLGKVREEEAVDVKPTFDAFVENPISNTARAMPEILAAQTAVGNNGSSVLNEFLRALAANGGAAAGNVGVAGMPPVPPQMDPNHLTHARRQQTQGVMPNPVNPAHGERHATGSGQGQTETQGRVRPGSPESSSSLSSWTSTRRSEGTPSRHSARVKTEQHNAAPTMAQPAFAFTQPPQHMQPPQYAQANMPPHLAHLFAAQPHVAQPTMAQSYMVQPPMAQPAYGQSALASLLSHLMQPPVPVQAAPSHALTELLRRLAVTSSAPQPPYPQAAPLHTQGAGKTLFDYSAPAYATADQLDIDMLGIRQLQHSTLAGLADVHRERIYLQGPRLEHCIQEARRLANPKRDLWTLGVMMFRQQVICDLAERIVKVNTARREQNPGDTHLPVDPLPIALMLQTLVCRPNELGIIGFEDLRKDLERDTTIQAVFSGIARPEQYEYFRGHVMTAVRTAEQEKNGATLDAFMNEQDFWKQARSEHQAATKAAYISRNGF